MDIKEDYVETGIRLKTIKHFVIYSGGLDSTQLLDTVGRLYGSVTNPVNAIRLHSEQFGGSNSGTKQCVAEKQAVGRYLGAAKNVGIHLKYHEFEIPTIPNDFMNFTNQAHLFSMMIPALTALAPTLNYNETCTEHHVYFGHISTDDFWKDGFSEKFCTICKTSFDLHEIQSQALRLNFPLKGMDKATVLSTFAEKYSNWRDLVWWCEEPRETLNDGFVSCHECNSCRVMHTVPGFVKLITPVPELKVEAEMTESMEKVVDKMEKEAS